jgi:hypothetical protein
MVRLKCGLHYYKRDGNCSLEQLLNGTVPTTADTIDEVDETANGTVSATGTIRRQQCTPLWQRSLLLRLPKDLMWYSTLLEQPCVDIVYFCLTNGTAGSADYTTTNVT